MTARFDIRAGWFVRCLVPVPLTGDTTVIVNCVHDAADDAERALETFRSVRSFFE